MFFAFIPRNIHFPHSNCFIFCQVFGIRKGQSESVLQELVHGYNGPQGRHSVTAQLHIKLLTLILKDLGQKYAFSPWQFYVLILDSLPYTGIVYYRQAFSFQFSALNFDKGKKFMVESSRELHLHIPMCFGRDPFRLLWKGQWRIWCIRLFEKAENPEFSMRWISLHRVSDNCLRLHFLNLPPLFLFIFPNDGCI